MKRQFRDESGEDSEIIGLFADQYTANYEVFNNTELLTLGQQHPVEFESLLDEHGCAFARIDRGEELGELTLHVRKYIVESAARTRAEAEQARIKMATFNTVDDQDIVLCDPAE